MSDESQVPAILKIGAMAEGPMPVVVVTDESVTEPEAHAYLDAAKSSPVAHGPVPLESYPVPLAFREGEYVLGELGSRRGRPAGSVATPPLHDLLVCNESIAEDLRPLVGSFFYGERVEIRVPPGTRVSAPVLDVPLFLRGELGDIDLNAGDFVCLDLQAREYAPDLNISSITCLYGVVPTSGQTQFIDVKELRVRVVRAPKLWYWDDDGRELEEPIGQDRASVIVHGTEYLELEAGPDVDVLATTHMWAAHVNLEGTGHFYAASIDVVRLGPAPHIYGEPTRQSGATGEGLVSLHGKFDLVVNDGGPSMQLVGDVADLTVVGRLPWLEINNASISGTAAIALWDASGIREPSYLSQTVLRAAEGFVPLLMTNNGSLRSTQAWRRTTYPEVIARRRERDHENHEDAVWAQSPSGDYLARRVIEAMDADLKTPGLGNEFDPLAPPAPKRVRDPHLHLDGFGVDSYGRMSPPQPPIDVDSINRTDPGPDGRGLDFGPLY